MPPKITPTQAGSVPSAPTGDANPLKPAAEKYFNKLVAEKIIGNQFNAARRYMQALEEKKAGHKSTGSWLPAVKKDGPKGNSGQGAYPLSDKETPQAPFNPTANDRITDDGNKEQHSTSDEKKAAPGRVSEGHRLPVVKKRRPEGQLRPRPPSEQISIHG
ncbi:hypothetical protein [Rhizobium sp. PDO1-076]|uniref:hypothetical protein n=1 Tax=Rhizobium sp. PDO1-076 TaxID=1125979 RepID=UPI0011473162|nr:hypothetical protein [Rhizobium sp. PDO1-076]